MKAGQIICFLFNVGGSYFDVSGRIRVGTHDDADGMLSLLRRYCGVWDKGGRRNFLARHGNQTFKFTSTMCLGFVYEVIECGLKKVGLRNAEVAKYTVGHYMKMLL